MKNCFEAGISKSQFCLFGSAGRRRQKSFKYYTSVFSCNTNWDRLFKRHFMSHYVLKTSPQTEDGRRVILAWNLPNIDQLISTNCHLLLFKPLRSFFKFSNIGKHFCQETSRPVEALAQLRRQSDIKVKRGFPCKCEVTSSVSYISQPCPLTALRSLWVRHWAPPWESL